MRRLRTEECYEFVMKYRINLFSKYTLIRKKIHHFNIILRLKHGWVWILWLLTQTWITIHIWSPKFQRLERAEILFVSPMYNGLLVDQSMTLNRRRKEILYENDDEEDDDGNPDNREYLELNNADQFAFPEDKIPKIYACATMWHETKDEMIEMLKSIFRMDEDQAARKIARKYFAVFDPDYYEFESKLSLTFIF